MHTPYMALIQLAEELETDTPEKRRFKKIILSLSDTVWDIYWKDDYSSINEVFNFIKEKQKDGK